ncbi:MAG: alcohol dehydrogenase [Deltaproteobacteria bacterium HGW-Deltaproteobacteria-6]|nr:MAG: alcohol dehydrogenase [Deltaproteobacteria bacterium HGW-Deltaproteobacteria-6]
MVPIKKSTRIKIRAAVVCKQDGPLKIETLEMEGPQDSEALIRIVACGVCHTDISMVHHWEASDGPLVLGHEGAGVVELTGSKVKAVRPGDHVILSYQSCGTCHPCKSGRPNKCRRFYELNFGFHRADGSNALEASGVRGHFLGQSSFASHVLATERNMVKVSRKLPLKVLAPLGCGMQTGAGTVMNMLHVRRGESVAVFGTGAVGLAAVMAARVAGACPIIGVDISPYRLNVALALGATHIINSRKMNAASAIREIAANGVNYVLETTGNDQMLHLTPEIAGKKGTIAFFTGNDTPDFLPRGMKAVHVVEGDSVPQIFIPRLIKLYHSGRFPFDRLLKFYDFKDINRAMKDSLSGKTIKPVLLMER